MTTTASRPRTARRWRAGAATAGLVLVLAACSSAPVVVPTPDTVTLQPTITPDKGSAPTPVLPATWPLTGVAGEVVARPALAVKIENTSMARPQTGLEQADVVWETIVEFDVARLVAVFQSQVPAEIGPIRSVRPMDMPIIAPLHGMFAYSGGQPGILALAHASGAQILSHDAGDAGFYRTKTRAAPHNVYGSPETFWASAEAGRTAPAEQFSFARTAQRAAAVRAGTPATTLTFSLSSASKPSWTWDAGSGTWLRSEGSSAAMAASGARLSAVNVVTIVAPHPPSGFKAQNNASVPTYSLVGSGEGTVATGGMTVPVTWSKAAEDQPMVLTLADGSAADLAPGNTWVELVPKETGSYTIG